MKQSGERHHTSNTTNVFHVKLVTVFNRFKEIFEPWQEGNLLGQAIVEACLHEWQPEIQGFVLPSSLICWCNPFLHPDDSLRGLASGCFPTPKVDPGMPFHTFH